MISTRIIGAKDDDNNNKSTLTSQQIEEIEPMHLAPPAYDPNEGIMVPLPPQSSPVYDPNEGIMVPLPPQGPPVYDPNEGIMVPLPPQGPPAYNPPGQLPPFRPPFFPPQGTSNYGNVRFIYAATDKPPLNVYIDNNAVVRSLRYSNVTPYYAVFTGNRTISVSFSSYPYTTQASINLSVMSGQIYTVAIINDNNGINLFVIPDTPCYRNDGYSCMRVVNLSQNSPTSNIFMTNAGLVFRSVGFKTITNYARFAPGNYYVYATDLRTTVLPVSNQVQVAIIGGTFRPWMTANINLQRSNTYTLYIIGNQNGFPAPQGVLAELDL